MPTPTKTARAEARPRPGRWQLPSKSSWPRRRSRMCAPADPKTSCESGTGSTERASRRRELATPTPRRRYDSARLSISGERDEAWLRARIRAGDFGAHAFFLAGPEPGRGVRFRVEGVSHEGRTAHRWGLGIGR